MPLQFPPHAAEECARFFFSFSRIESALKETGCWKTQNGGVAPDWNTFIERNEAAYTLSDAGAELLRLDPMRQVAIDRTLTWQPLFFKPEASNMKRVVETLKTVRNNLFHGGKTGGDAEHRTIALMRCGTAVIEELAQMGLENEYRGTY